MRLKNSREYNYNPYLYLFLYSVWLSFCSSFRSRPTTCRILHFFVSSLYKKCIEHLYNMLCRSDLFSTYGLSCVLFDYFSLSISTNPKIWFCTVSKFIIIKCKHWTIHKVHLIWLQVVAVFPLHDLSLLSLASLLLWARRTYNFEWLVVLDNWHSIAVGYIQFYLEFCLLFYFIFSTFVRYSQAMHVVLYNMLFFRSHFCFHFHKKHVSLCHAPLYVCHMFGSLSVACFV